MENKIKIGVLGSCSTRNVFTTYYNDYKNHFELIFSYERISLISLFNEPIPFEMDDLKISPDNPTNRFRTRNLKKDFSKSFLGDLEKKIDYLIIDFYFEALFGVLIFDKGIITNNIWDLPDTKFNNELNNSYIFTMYGNEEKYFEMWKKSCDNLFSYINDLYPNVRIILNRMCLVDKVLREDYSCYINTDFSWMVKTYGHFIKRFEDYIIENFDVEIVECSEENFTSEFSRWDPYVVHHTDDYYKFVYWKICEIVGVDESHLSASRSSYLSERSLLCNNLRDNNSPILEKIKPRIDDEKISKINNNSFSFYSNKFKKFLQKFK
ncbi:DUF6270 domain-containing protein [uncultured Methanobrevibacter sp.]|uniref:DUF6270 domain-containing protein n=1 Tax=uncultured Methanobrevibacter sp. TaxID=253161 RepID=UPI0025CEFAF0|nr:DUF6270 domain-containing protein [uncultured Methanobrevibacter sp.]